MKIRRIVTGHDANGKSVFQSDAPAPRTVSFQHVPGLAAALVWETAPTSKVGAQDDPTLAARSWVPPAGGSNLMLVTFPPDSVMASPQFDRAAAGGEYFQHLPGLAEAFERDSPGMHTTPTVDYSVLLNGALDLELDDGATRSLEPGDVVVQNGTRHAWRNRSNEPATILFVLLGACRD